jgi:excisionase family DNA binding protein
MSKLLVTLTVDELRELVRNEVASALAQRGPELPPDPVLSAEKAAEFLGMPVNILRKRARDGVIPSMKIGALVRFRHSALNAWLATQPSARKTA